MKSQNVKVQNFLNEIMLIDAEKYEQLIEMRNIIFKIYPKVEEKFMYGGIIFSQDSEDFSGLFVRKNHISVEFSKGYLFKDSKKILEGSGKFRRHLKIRNKEDISDKEVGYFVEKAYQK